uniref:GPI transamidase component PIG-S n=1 Tax=Schizophyllum commune (strain H4-8 / FGSC 9210) TaxID=578458 RepID=D8QHB6_SCHCM
MSDEGQPPQLEVPLSHADTRDDSQLHEQPDSPLKDPSKIYYQANHVRRLIIASYWLVIFLALPLWWKTTSIERLSLPQGRIGALGDKNLRFDIGISVPNGRVREALDTPAFKERLVSAGVDVHATSSDKYGKSHAICTDVSDGKFSLVRTQHIDLPTSADTVLDVLTSLLVPQAVDRRHEQHIVPFAPRYQLSFSLLNEDAADGTSMLSWPIRENIKKHLSPTLNDLASLYNFTIESQVQFHAPLAFEPVSLREAGLTPEQLTVFVNSAEWSLSSSVSNDPVLHFLLFVPKRPLYILNDSGEPSPSRAFLIPQWGGIVLADTDLLTSDPAAQVDTAFATFRAQLVTLLGVPQLPAGITARVPSGHISAWQADALLRRRARESAQEARDTLSSISRLVDQIENMPVGARVRDDVQGALQALEMAYSSASASMLSAFQHAAQATVLASRAFFSPGMLQLLYFPPEHIYAVYMPLFASALIPLLATAAREVKAWRRERAVPAA